MEPSIEKRQEWLNDLDVCISQASEKVNGVLSSLEWSKDHLLENELASCPHQPGHSMPPLALHKHLHYCPLVGKGYTREELDQDQSSAFFYEKATTVIPVSIDDVTYRNIISSVLPGIRGQGQSRPREMPATLQRVQQETTPAERRALYEYCVERAKESMNHVKIPEEELMLLTDNKRGEDKYRSKSYIERLAESRDLKRRRQSYRAKNVHTTKKSNTEIIREVIENQMKILSDLWQEEDSDTESCRGNDALDHHQKSSGEREMPQRTRNGSSSRDIYRSTGNRSHTPTSPYNREDDSRYHDRRRRSHSREKDQYKRRRSRSYEKDQYSDRSDDSHQSKYKRDRSPGRHRKHKKHKKHKHKHHKVKKEKRDSDEESDNSKEVALQPQS